MSVVELRRRSGDRARCLRRIGSAGDGPADDQNIGAVVERGAWCGDALLVLGLSIGGANAGNDGEKISRRRRLDRSHILWAADNAGKARPARQLCKGRGMVAAAAIGGKSGLMDVGVGEAR